MKQHHVDRYHACHLKRLPSTGLHALQDDEHAMHSHEESFVSVLLSAVTGRPESDAEADGVLRTALQLALNAGYLQAQAQVRQPSH